MDGIRTAPLNKEALHAAGHLYPGHTTGNLHGPGAHEAPGARATPRTSPRAHATPGTCTPPGHAQN
ncbi:hypothetical protein [Streptomyces africanus]|uniref:hypothetical protein n=1 Tax=Streptomyces africanus TaxID=231024 RepID=UPI0027D8F70F|nr:hypothetical protein [Streptomyces africanus]